MQIHPLLSDWFLYALFIIFVVTILCQASKKSVQATWGLLTRSRPAMFSLVILLIFFFIALCDSIHLQIPEDQRQHGEASLQSVLDRIAPRLAFSYEKTYSRPLANKHATPSNFTDKTGKQEYGHAPLQHITRHTAHARGVMQTALMGALWGCLTFVGLGIIALLARSAKHRESPLATLRRFLPDHTPTVWSTILITTACVLIIGGAFITSACEFHLFGTNRIGQDVFYESLKSIRTGIIIGTLSTVFMLPFALILGLFSGYFRGWTDDIIQYIYTTLSSIPGVLLISATILVMQLYIHTHPNLFSTLADQADARLIALCLILGLTSWANLCRLLRAETLKVKTYDFVQAAKMMRIRKPLILWRHILPNIFHIVLITIALDFSGLVLAEAVLSYIGVGVDPTTPSWGNVINSARLEMAREPTVWWRLSSAMGMMFFLVLSANLFADALRDALDPAGRSSKRERIKTENPA